jgi:hypothetical protein
MDIINGHTAGVQHGEEHAVWTGACSMDSDMQRMNIDMDMDKTWTYIDYYWTSADS